MTIDNENTPNEAEATAELAKSEDVTAYVEQRQEEEADARPPEDETAAIAREMRESDAYSTPKSSAGDTARLGVAWKAPSSCTGAHSTQPIKPSSSTVKGPVIKQLMTKS